MRASGSDSKGEWKGGIFIRCSWRQFGGGLRGIHIAAARAVLLPLFISFFSSWVCDVCDVCVWPGVWPGVWVGGRGAGDSTLKAFVSVGR